MNHAFLGVNKVLSSYHHKSNVVHMGEVQAHMRNIKGGCFTEIRSPLLFDNLLGSQTNLGLFLSHDCNYAFGKVFKGSKKARSNPHLNNASRYNLRSSKSSIKESCVKEVTRFGLK